jgi:hypothetical protein
MFVNCFICGKQKYITLTTYQKNKHKKFFCNHKCIGKYIKIEENKLTKKKYKEGDILGCFKLISFSHRKKSDYYWKVKCLKCNEIYVYKLSAKSMSNTKNCRKCVKGKHINFKTPEEYIKAKTTIDKNGCWLWNGYVKKDGYAYSKYRGIQKKAHAFSYQTFKGVIPKGMFVCHTCDVRHCINPKHLWIGTAKDNSIDCVKKGRDNPPQGEKNGTSKLKDKDILNIRKEFKNGMQQKEIAKQHNISKTNVCVICNKKTWKHIKD